MSLSNIIKTFTRGGIHPPEHKELTASSVIVDVPAGKRVIVPLQLNLGAPSKPVVKAKERVLMGQEIAKASGFVSAPIHSSVSGKVKKIDYYPSSNGPRSLCVEIQNDGKDEWVDDVDLTASFDEAALQSCTKDEILSQLQAVGLVGMGGATFPSHVKLKPPGGVELKALILNGAECEPYLTADHRLMIEHSKEITWGLRLLMKVLGVARAFVGIEDNKPDAVAAMREAIRDVTGAEVVVCKTRYPQGAEKQLIRSVMGVEVPSGKLPMHVGAVVFNVGTAFAAFEAVARRKPLIERVVTISGGAITEPRNVRARVGTLISDIVEFCGGLGDDFHKMIVGGPMMGRAVRDFDVPVLKGTSGVLFFTAAEGIREPTLPCIRCGECLSVCPQGLVPCEMALLAENECWETLPDIMDCVECGACQYACPSNRPLLHLIRLGKSELRAVQRKSA